MQNSYKKIRSLIWIIHGIFRRHYVTILASFVIGIIIVLLGINFRAVQEKNSSKDHKSIGLSGAYTPTTLPANIQRLISSGLTDLTTNGEVVPSLAKNWDVDREGKIYTFRLRDDIYWHDGKKFTAYDVNYNLRDVEITPRSDTELEVKLKEPFAPLPSFLSKAIFRKGHIGTGSYKIEAIKFKGDVISYLKLTSALSDLPELDIRFYPSESVAQMAFKLGEVDVLDEIIDPSPFKDWNTVTIKDNEKYTRFVGLFFNNNADALKEKEFRQALSFAIEKPVNNRVATPFSSKHWAYTNRVKQYDQDIDQAKKLLSEQNASPSGELIISTYPQYLDLASQIVSDWASIGVMAKVQIEDGVPDNYQVLLTSQEIPPDPDQYALWHSTQTVTNITHYANPKIDKLLEDGRKELDLEKRKKIYYDFQRYLVDDAPAVFLYHPSTYTITRN